jgi:hypothetical protein
MRMAIWTQHKNIYSFLINSKNNIKKILVWIKIWKNRKENKEREEKKKWRRDSEWNGQSANHFVDKNE